MERDAPFPEESFVQKGKLSVLLSEEMTVQPHIIESGYFKG